MIESSSKNRKSPYIVEEVTKERDADECVVSQFNNSGKRCVLMFCSSRRSRKSIFGILYRFVWPRNGPSTSSHKISRGNGGFRK